MGITTVGKRNTTFWRMLRYSQFYISCWKLVCSGGFILFEINIANLISKLLPSNRVWLNLIFFSTKVWLDKATLTGTVEWPYWWCLLNLNGMHGLLQNLHYAKNCDHNLRELPSWRNNALPVSAVNPACLTRSIFHQVSFRTLLTLPGLDLNSTWMFLLNLPIFLVWCWSCKIKFDIANFIP